MVSRPVAALVGWTLAASAGGVAQSRSPIVSAVDAQVGGAPALVRISGREHLVYELHVTNFMRSDVTLTRIEAGDASRGTTLVDLRGAALSSRIGRPGSPPDLPDKRLIGPGLRAVIYFWLPLDQGTPVPARVRHLIGVDVMRTGQRSSVDVAGAEADVRKDPPVVLGPPLRGGFWVAMYDPMLVGGHRTALYAVDGRARVPGRFAIDFVRLEDDGSHARGDRTAIASWHGYGAEVVAVADGTIVEASDDIPEAPTLAATPAPIPLENVSGNFVSLDLGGGRYAFYEHLKHGSVRVKPGDRVKTGDVLGLLGNSGGSSSGPHLHFHVADASAELAAEGVPYVFAAFETVGAFDSIGALTTGGRWKSMPGDASGSRRSELPAPNSVVVFPAR